MSYFDINTRHSDPKRKRPRWRRGNEWTDEEIDFSDIPPLTEEFFARAVRNPYYGRIDENMPVDARWDCIDWLKAKFTSARTRLGVSFRERLSRASKNRR